jgi:hypothetical protein
MQYKITLTNKDGKVVAVQLVDRKARLPYAIINLINNNYWKIGAGCQININGDSGTSS